MTHIIIPIIEIEKLLKIYTQEIKEAGLYQDKTKFTKFTGKHSGLNTIYNLGKQISLDEEDIEKKDFPNKNRNYSYGYKQALKDLL